MIMFNPLSAENTRSTARRSASSKSKLIGCPVYCFAPVPGTSVLNVCGAVDCAGGGGGACCCADCCAAGADCVACAVLRAAGVARETGGNTRGVLVLAGVGGFVSSAVIGSAGGRAAPLASASVRVSASSLLFW